MGSARVAPRWSVLTRAPPPSLCTAVARVDRDGRTLCPAPCVRAFLHAGPLAFRAVGRSGLWREARELGSASLLPSLPWCRPHLNPWPASLGAPTGRGLGDGPDSPQWEQSSTETPGGGGGHASSEDSGQFAFS